ncbi:MAG: VOC family protein [Actinomycetota bacterium]|nr:VOC family protein [Actinomycetota bacterium]
MGFEELAVHRGGDGTVHHAELAFEGEVIMLGSASDGSDGRMAGQFGPAVTYLATDGVDALYERVQSAGAELEYELRETDYGSREFAARDAEGNVWSVGTYRPSADG